MLPYYGYNNSDAFPCILYTWCKDTINNSSDQTFSKENVIVGIERWGADLNVAKKNRGIPLRLSLYFSLFIPS